MFVESPPVVGREIPQQYQTGSNNLGYQVMQLQRGSTKRHDKAVEKQTDQGNDEKLGHGFLMAFFAGKRVTIIQQVVCQCSSYESRRRCLDSTNGQDVYQEYENTVMNKGANCADTGKL